MEVDDKKEDLKQKLLPDNHEGSDENMDFKSCHSGDEEEDIVEEPSNSLGQLKSTSSLNYDGEEHKGRKKLNVKEESKSDEDNDKKEIKGEINSRLNTLIKSIKNDDDLPFLNTKKKKKKTKASTFWKELLDLIYFCYEFLLVMAVIGTGIIMPAIPNSIYVLLSILYIGMTIKLSSARMSHTI